jgi:hypothetical protein
MYIEKGLLCCNLGSAISKCRGLKGFSPSTGNENYPKIVSVNLDLSFIVTHK